MTSSPTANGSGAKRLKKESGMSSYAIVDTKSPADANRRPRSIRSDGDRTPSSTSKRVPPMTDPSATATAPAPPPRVIPLPEGVLDTGRHTHHGLNWLYKDRVDKAKRRPHDAEYNPRTLYVPRAFLDKQTPAMRQWWEFKSENMDTILFFKVSCISSRRHARPRGCNPVHMRDIVHFLERARVLPPSNRPIVHLKNDLSNSDIHPRALKASAWAVIYLQVGKFYELFHQDADVGMQELDLIYMKGEKAHSGFPEISYGKFADILVSKGFRVARVEQVKLTLYVVFSLSPSVVAPLSCSRCRLR